MERPGIDQYLILSMLLHVFAIIALGDTRGGESRHGARGQGSIFVTLTEPAANERIAVRAGRQMRVDERSARPAQRPGEASSRASEPIALPAALERIEAPKIEREFAAAPDLAADAFRAQPLEPIAAPASAQFREAPRIPAASPRPELREPLAPVVPPRIETGFVEHIEVRPADRPALTTLPPVAPAALQEFAAPARSIPRERGAAPQLQPLEPLPAPSIGRFAAPADTKVLEAPRASTGALQPLAPLAPSAVAAEFAAPDALKAADTAVNVPPALENIPAPRVDQEFAQFVPPAAREDARPAVEATPSPATPAAAPGGQTGAVAPPAAPPAGASTLPKTDLDRIKDQARNIARQGTGPRTAIPFFTAPPPPKKDTEKAFDKALQRPDCKDAYAEMGLAAVIPLVRDALTEKGCKW